MYILDETGEPCSVGTYSSDPGSCTTYLICAGGEKKRQQCAPGLHWNAAAMLCDWPTAAQCISNGGTTLSFFLSIIIKISTELNMKCLGMSMMTSTPATFAVEVEMTTHRPMYTTTQWTTTTTTTQRQETTTHKKPTRKPTGDHNHHHHHPHKKPTKPPQMVSLFLVKEWGLSQNFGLMWSFGLQSCNNGAYYAHNECDMFNICVNNRLIAQVCAPGLIWNQEETMCDYASKTTCKNNGATFKKVAAVLSEYYYISILFYFYMIFFYLPILYIKTNLVTVGQCYSIFFIKLQITI